MRFTALGEFLLAALVSLTSTMGALADASSFPNYPVKIIVPYPAGGGSDVAARLVASKMSAHWGQSVIVENRTGAAGLIGANAVATAAPDGYTILISPSPVFSSLKWLSKNSSFDPETDLKPVSMILISPNVLMVSEKLPIKNLKELLDYAKGNPGSATYASQGIGTTGHLTGAYLAQVSGIPLQNVPYRGAAPAANDLIAGVVTMAWDGLSSARGMIAGGRVRAIAVASKKRADILPDVPTVIESGFNDFESASWYAVAAPKGTPDEIVSKLNAAVVEALKDPAVKKQLTDMGAEVGSSTPQELAAYMKTDAQRWKQVIEAAKIETGDK